MTKVTLIGAGSAVFGQGFITDILTRPALADATLSLMDINPDNLAIAEALVKKIAGQVNAPARIEATILSSIEPGRYIWDSFKPLPSLCHIPARCHWRQRLIFNSAKSILRVL